MRKIAKLTGLCLINAGAFAQFFRQKGGGVLWGSLGSRALPPAFTTLTGDFQVLGNSKLAIVTTGTSAVIKVGENYNYYPMKGTGSPLKAVNHYSKTN